MVTLIIVVLGAIALWQAYRFGYEKATWHALTRFDDEEL